jgi:hypothetical protein
MRERTYRFCGDNFGGISSIGDFLGECFFGDTPDSSPSLRRPKSIVGKPDRSSAWSQINASAAAVDL